MTTFSEGSDIRVTILGKVAGLKEEGLGFSVKPSLVHGSHLDNPLKSGLGQSAFVKMGLG